MIVSRLKHLLKTQHSLLAGSAGVWCAVADAPVLLKEGFAR